MLDVFVIERLDRLVLEYTQDSGVVDLRDDTCVDGNVKICEISKGSRKSRDTPFCTWL